MQGGTVSTYLNAKTLETLDGYVSRNSKEGSKLSRSKFISICIKQGLAFALEREEATKQKEATHDTDPIYK
jgi:hypothetical protein